MESPQTSLVVSGGIAVLALVMIGVWLSLLWRANPPGRTTLVGRFAVILFAWAALWLVLAQVGVLRQSPAFILLVPSMTLGVVWLSRSLIGTVLAFETPLWLLIGAQAFRLPLELVMHVAASEGVMPGQMTFGAGGLNYDIVTGATALLVALLLRNRELPRVFLLAWNMMGLLLLVNIVVVAVLSTPVFARFGHEASQLNTWVLFAPYIWLPAVLVGSAMLGHFLIFRRLAR